MTEIYNRRFWMYLSLEVSGALWIAVLICYVLFTAILFRRGERSLGTVMSAMAVLCFPGFWIGVALGLGYGWTKARSWRIPFLMVTWTILTILAIASTLGWIFVRFYTTEAAPWGFDA